MSGQGYLRQTNNRLLSSPVEHLDHITFWRTRQDTFHFAKAEFGISVNAIDNEFVLDLFEYSLHAFQFRLYTTKS